MKYAVRLDEVTKRYGDFVAVNRVSFRVPTGVVYGILGPNGAGKSTMLRMLNDIIAPDEGSIELLGGVTPGPAAAPRIGYLPEERGLYPTMKVRDVLQFFAELRGVSAKQGRARAVDWLERLGIGEWQNAKVRDLSKGMQQKVQFATSLIHEPELVILDEPWSGLDPINADVLRDVVAEQKAAGKTVLFSTHLMEQAESICDHVCIIARGKVVVDGSLEEVIADAAPEGQVVVEASGGHEESLGTLATSSDLVAKAEPHRGGWRIKLHAAGSADEFLAAVVARGISLKRFERVAPTLHQVFVDRVTGEETTETTEAKE